MAFSNYGSSLTDIVAFEIKVREVKGDLVLWRRGDLPDAHLVGWVEFGKGRTGDGTVESFDEATTGLFTVLPVRV